MSGRVAGANQRVSRDGALKAVTLDAAFSLGLEKEVGSIVSGKLANLTILEDNPVTCDPAKIKDIKVWGTLHEGRKLPLAQSQTNSSHQLRNLTYMKMAANTPPLAAYAR
jgi:predicted amidohydrolase YtcJ